MTRRCKRTVLFLAYVLFILLIIDASTFSQRNEARSERPPTFEENLVSVVDELDGTVSGIPHKDLDIKSLYSDIKVDPGTIREKIRQTDVLLNKLSTMKAPDRNILEIQRKLIKDVGYIRKGLEITLDGSKKKNDELFERGSIMISTNLTDIYDTKRLVKDIITAKLEEAEKVAQ